MKLIVELYENGRKVADLPAAELEAMTQREYNDFWKVQKMLCRKARWAVEIPLITHEGPARKEKCHE